MLRWDAHDDENRAEPGALRLLVADRQPLVRAALTALLVADGHAVVVDAGDGACVLAALAQAPIDLAIIDIDLEPAALIGTARQRRTAPPVVILAPAASHPSLPAALESGVAGIALKSEGPEQLRLCIAAVAACEHWVDSTARAHIAGQVQAHRDSHHLTRRERDVARLVATGQRNRAIASMLGIAEGTVKMHLHNIFAKLGLESRTQLAMDERVRVTG